MFKKISLLTILLISFFILNACSVNKTVEKEEGETKIIAAATIFPIYDLLKEVGGDKVDAYLILKPGASPHTYEPQPSQIVALSSAEVFFYNGLHLDDWAKNLAKDLDLKLVDLSHYVQLLDYHHEDHDDDHHHDHDHGDIDPHYWLDPNNAILMFSSIANYLSELDSDNSDFYQQRANEAIEKLSLKISEWQGLLNNLDNRKIIVFHDAWNYFANFFNVEVLASFEPFPGQTPSPHYIINLENVVKNNNINTLFIEPQLSQEALISIAADLNVEIETLDPLGGVDGRLNYVDLIDYNVNTIYQALSK